MSTASLCLSKTKTKTKTTLLKELKELKEGVKLVTAEWMVDKEKRS